MDGGLLARRRECSQYIALPDKVLLHSRQWGSNGHTCLLLHGFGDGAYIWDGCIPYLSPFGRLIALDLRGHGRSQWDGQGRYCAQMHLADVLFVVDELRLSHFSIVGHSLGGNIAVGVAAARVQQVLGLVLVDYGLKTNKAASAHVRRDFAAQFRRYRSTTEYVDWLSRRRPIADRRELQRIAAGALCRSEDGYQLRCDPALVDADDPGGNASLVASLRSVECPSLLIRGEASAVLPLASAWETVRHLRHGRLVTVPASGHAVMSDNPRGFAEAVRSFFARTASW
jgi:pimeloyl-ACP methyl ester carboxylesterase